MVQIIPVGEVPRGPQQPRVNPAAYGSQGIQNLAAQGRAYVDERITQKQATDLAMLRANAAVETDQFLQDVGRETDFATIPSRTQEFVSQRTAAWQATVDPVVWDAFQPDLVRLQGHAESGASQIAHAREDDHFIAQADVARENILGLAGQPGSDHAHNLEMIETNWLELYRSGRIDEQTAINGIQRDQEAYRIDMHTAGILRDPLGWAGAHGALPSATVRSGETQAIVAAAAEGLFEPIPISGHRSTSQQADLYAEYQAAQARGEHPEPVAAPGHSQHETGGAVDYAYPRQEDGAVNGLLLSTLLGRLIQQGFTGFGFYSDHDGNGHFHVDRDNPIVRIWGDEYMPAEVRLLFEEQGVEDGASRRGIPQFSEGGAYVGETMREPLPGLSARQSAALYNQAEREADRALATERVAIQGQAQDYITGLTNGIDMAPPSDAAIMRAYTFNPAGGAEIISGLRAAEGLTDTLQAMNGMSDDDLRTFLVSEREALQGGPGLTERVQRVGILAEAGQDILAARENPAAYVAAQDEAIRNMYANAQTPEDWAEAITTSLDRQAEVTDRRQALPPDYVTSLMERYNDNDTPPQARVEMLLALTQHDAGALVFDQLEEAGLDTAMRYVIAAAPRIGLPAAAGLASILADPQLQEDFDALYPTDAGRDSAVAELLASYNPRLEMYDGRESIIGDAGQSANARRAEADAFIRIAKGLAVRQRGSPDLSTAGTETYARLFGGDGIIEEPLGYAIVPADSAGPISDGMEAVRAGVEANGIALAEALGIPGLDRENVSAWEDLVEGARWVNEGDGYALALPVRGTFGSLLVGEDGEVLVWSADQLVTTGEAAQVALDAIPTMTDATVNAARVMAEELFSWTREEDAGMALAHASPPGSGERIGPFEAPAVAPDGESPARIPESTLIRMPPAGAIPLLPAASPPGSMPAGRSPAASPAPPWIRHTPPAVVPAHNRETPPAETASAEQGIDTSEMSPLTQEAYRLGFEPNAAPPFDSPIPGWDGPYTIGQLGAGGPAIQIDWPRSVDELFVLLQGHRVRANIDRGGSWDVYKRDELRRYLSSQFPAFYRNVYKPFEFALLDGNSIGGETARDVVMRVAREATQ